MLLSDKILRNPKPGQDLGFRFIRPANPGVENSEKIVKNNGLAKKPPKPCGQKGSAGCIPGEFRSFLTICSEKCTSNQRKSAQRNNGKVLNAVVTLPLTGGEQHEFNECFLKIFSVKNIQRLDKEKEIKKLPGKGADCSVFILLGYRIHAALLQRK